MDKGFTPGSEAALLLLRVRIAMAGEGAIQEAVGATKVVLPGPGFYVEMEGGDRAKMHYPYGRALSAMLTLSDPGHFASMMHNVDVCTFGDAESRIRGMGERGTPSSLPAFADAYARAVMAGDARLAALVPQGDINLLSNGGPWDAPPLAKAMAEAAAAHEDPDLSVAAGAFLRDLALGVSRPFDSLTSLVRWGRQVEGWVEPEFVAHESRADHAWLRIATEAGVVAAARELGWLEGQLMTGPKAEAERDARPLDELVEDLLAGRGLPSYGDGGTVVYVLAGPDGGIVAAATVEDEEVVVRGRKGHEDSYDDHAGALREALGLPEPALRFG